MTSSSTPTPQLRLCRGIATSDLSMVRQALSEGANPSLGPLGEKTYYPLQRAIERALEHRGGDQDIQIMQCLLEAGVDPRHNSGAYMNARGRGLEIGLIAYLVASQAEERVDRSMRCLDLLLKHWPTTHAWHEVLLDDGMPILHWAARYQHVKPVELLIHHGCNINSRDEVGNTALIWARSGKIAKTLLELGANAHAYNHDRKSVLWNAVGSGYREVWSDTIHAVLDTEPDLSREVRFMDLARRVKKRIQTWQEHWKPEDLDALKRLQSNLVRHKLQRKVKGAAAEVEPKVLVKATLRM